MIFMHAFYGPSDANAPNGFAMSNYNDVSATFTGADADPLATGIPTAATFNQYTVNGQYQPTVDGTVGDVMLFRIVNGGGWRMLYAQFEVAGTVTNACTMRLIARDGVFQTLDNGAYPTISAIVMVPGTRADVAVQCDAAGTYRLSANTPPAGYSMGTGNFQTQDSIFDFVVAGTTPTPLPFPTQAAPFPSYLADLSTATVQPNTKNAQNPTYIQLAGGEVNGNVFPGFDNANLDTRYESRFCRNQNYEVHLGPQPVRRLSLGTEDAARGRALTHGPPHGPGGGGGGAGGGDKHPYHQHINHFQITNDGGHADATPEAYRVGEWRDVVSAMDQDIRFPTDAFAGDVVLHCHILQVRSGGR